MALEIITKNSRQTQKVAEALARQLVEECKPGRKVPRLCSGQAVVLALRGDLGSGKTTFIQGFAKGLGIKEKILSPTFVILKKFKITKRKTKSEKRKTTIQDLKYLYHLDCYRVDSPQEILDLGFKEIIADAKNIVIIEWAERIKKVLPKSTWWLKFRWVGRNKREIILKMPNPSVKLKAKSEKQQRKI